MIGQTFIEVGVVGFEQVQHTPVFPQDAFEKQFRFPSQGPAQIIVEIGKQSEIGHDGFQIAQVQPLLGKIVHQVGGPGIRQHAAHLLLQDFGLAEASLDGFPKQFIIRQAAPNEKG